MSTIIQRRRTEIIYLPPEPTPGPWVTTGGGLGGLVAGLGGLVAGFGGFVAAKMKNWSVSTAKE